MCQVMSEKAFPVLDIITAKYGNPENTKRVRTLPFLHKPIMMSTKPHVNQDELRETPA